MCNDLATPTDQNQGADLQTVMTPGRYIPWVPNKKHYVKLTAKIARLRTKCHIKWVNAVLAEKCPNHTHCTTQIHTRKQQSRTGDNTTDLTWKITNRHK